ncbi:MAG: DUF86 domain-containing protein [Magnetococcales bacterium]|nr:DUF86 domain-containing protein [Magnetococcales bacterium]MBF0434181.1 DUF86 domain-containing protein [Magnetococcales bacterium]
MRPSLALQNHRDAVRIHDYSEHISEAIERIDRYVLGMTETNFLAEEKTQDAVIRNLEIIGEAAHNMGRYHPVFAAEHPQVPWAILYALRNRLSQGYYKVDLELLWRVIHCDLLELYVQTCPLRNSLA